MADCKDIEKIQTTKWESIFLREMKILLGSHSSSIWIYPSNASKENLSDSELEQWLGICIYFSISKLPNTRMHWSPQAGKLKKIVSDIMTCNRWEMIKSKFHLVENNSITDHALDKLFKIRPMVNSFREKRVYQWNNILLLMNKWFLSRDS